MKTVGLVVGNVGGKMLGLVREVLLAYFFGATATADAFRASLTAALVPTHFFMGDVLEGAFVPLYVRRRVEDPDAAARLLGLVSLYLLIVSSGVAVLLWVGGDSVVRVVAPGLAPGTVAIAGRIVRWMAVGIPLYCFAHLMALRGLIVGRGRALALRSPALNAGFVVAILAAAAFHDPQWIGLGFSVALAAYCGYAWREVRLASAPEAAHAWVPGAGEGALIAGAALPLVGMMVLGQLLALVDRVAASFAGVGGLASLEYARTLVETPQALVGVAMATTSLSAFAGMPEGQVRRGVGGYVLPILTGSLAFLLALAVAAPEIVAIVYRRGQFDARAAQLVTSVIRGMAVGGAFSMAAYVMIRVLSARLRSREAVPPMAAAIATAALGNVIMVPRLGILGVALAMSAGQLVLCCLVAWRLGVAADMRRRVPGWTLGAILVAGLGAAGAMVGGSPWVRAGLLGPGSLAAFAGGCALTAETRADLVILRDHLARLVRKLRRTAT